MDGISHWVRLSLLIGVHRESGFSVWAQAAESGCNSLLGWLIDTWAHWLSTFNEAEMSELLGVMLWKKSKGLESCKLWSRAIIDSLTLLHSLYYNTSEGPVMTSFTKALRDALVRGAPASVNKLRDRGGGSLEARDNGSRMLWLSLHRKTVRPLEFEFVGNRSRTRTHILWLPVWDPFIKPH